MLGFLSAQPQLGCLCVNRREHTAQVAQTFSFQGTWDLHIMAVPLSCVCPVMLPSQPCSPPHSQLLHSQLPTHFPHPCCGTTLWDQTSLHYTAMAGKLEGWGLSGRKGCPCDVRCWKGRLWSFSWPRLVAIKTQREHFWAQSLSGHTTKKKEANKQSTVGRS